jgi:H+/Cl- antiporter ClcA
VATRGTLNQANEESFSGRRHYLTGILRVTRAYLFLVPVAAAYGVEDRQHGADEIEEANHRHGVLWPRTELLKR